MGTNTFNCKHSDEIMREGKTLVSNWGNFPRIEANIKNIYGRIAIKEYFKETEHMIPRGYGRCYGDSSLSRNIISTSQLNRFLVFDEQMGVLACESGVSICEVLALIVRKGWFLPVTPGTKFVTIGGAIASDVHGKNHHKDGSFADHVISMDLILPDGEICSCSREDNRELFRATCGGMGLTGVILNATFSLKRMETPYIRQTIKMARNIDEVAYYFDQYGDSTYSVAWIDCLAGGKNLGRSILMLGEHARSDDMSHEQLAVRAKKEITVPFNLPGFLLNRWSIKGFNSFFYNKHRVAPKESLVYFDEFFYPLDSILHWNRIYGSGGFLQYQLVLHKDSGLEGLKKILERISKRGDGSFLAVLKLFGKGNDNLLSFPMEGYTLALDFPMREGLFDFFDELDRMVLDYGGRLYLTKDARMSRGVFNDSYKNVGAFLNIKRKIDSENRFRSLQSDRIGI